MNDNQYKICDSCRKKNELQEPFCVECFGTNFSNINITNEDDIEQVEINESKNINVEYDNKTIIEIKTKTLELFNTIINQVVHHNDVVGRSAVCANILQKYTKVSREHAKFYIENNICYIEDLESTNGTYINDKRITPKQKIEIFHDDVLKLSSTFSITVVIK